MRPSNHSPAGAMIGPMTPTVDLVGLLLRLAALLSSSLVQSGASGYVAVMGLCGVSVTVMRPTAFTLNVLVASVVTAWGHRAGSRPRSHPLNVSGTGRFAVIGPERVGGGQADG